MDSSKDSALKRNPNRYEGERSCDSEMSSIQGNAGNLESDNTHDQTNSVQCGVEFQKSDLINSTSNVHNEQFVRLNDDTVTNYSNAGNSRLSGYSDEQIAIAGSSSADFYSPGHSVISAKVSSDMPNDNLCIPSTSSGQENATSGLRENRKRPSSLKLNQSNLDIESSSDTGNDDYSLGSEDGCIYTYRGGEHLADLPSSFFSLDMGLPMDRHLPISGNYAVPQQAAPNAREQGSRTSSPDMDFLEMDFDPGPSCDADSGDESSPEADLEVMNNIPEDNEPVFRVNTPDGPLPRLNVQSYSIPISSASQGSELQCINAPSTSRGGQSGAGDNVPESKNVETYGPFITHVNASGQKLLVRRTMSHWPSHSSIILHVSSGDLVSPREVLHCEDQHRESPFAYQINQGENSADMSSALYHLNMAKKLLADEIKTIPEEGNISINMIGDGIVKTESEGAEITVCAETPRIMVWSEREACERQVTQIATSACGATAVVNVFIVLGVPVNIERINTAVGTRQRANTAPLPRYLLSRAVAGCTAADLVNGIQRASDGLVAARFFPTYPERAVSLSHWLADWISLGAVPVLTLNLQVGCEGEIPDAWHHQMVFGVSSRGIYLCNPVECVPETVLWPRLTSPSVLLVRTRDALARYTTSTDLTPLMAVPDRRFHTFNVMGQVANVIREWRATDWSEYGTRTRHIRIPASYQAGVTVAALTGSEAHRRLMQAPNLPLLAPHSDPTIR